MGVVEDCRFAEGRHPWRSVPACSKGWVISVDYQTQRDALQPKFMKFLSKSRIAYKTMRERDVWDRIILTCGRCMQAPRRQGDRRDPGTETWWCVACNLPCSIITFKSVDQGEEKFQAVDLDWAHFDEEPPKRIFNEVRARLVDRGGPLWMTFTPVKGASWTLDEIYDAAEKATDIPVTAKDGTRATAKAIEVFHMTMYDNPYLKRENVEKFEKGLGDQTEIDIRVYGKYGVFSGLIFKQWDPDRHEVPLSDFTGVFCDPDGKMLSYYDTYCGIDTGTHFAATFWLVDLLGNLWGFDEHLGVGKSTRENTRAIQAICRRWDVWPDFYVDPRSQIIPDLQEDGIPVNQAPGDEVFGGIAVIQQYMSAVREKGGHPGMFVVREMMPGWLRERSRYRWADAPKTGQLAGIRQDKPLKRDDHHIDSFRYVAILRPQASVARDMGKDQPIAVRIRESVRAELIARDRGIVTDDEY